MSIVTGAPGSMTPGDVADFNQKLVDAEEFLEARLLRREREEPVIWNSMIGRSPYPLGAGIERKQYIFHPGIGEQVGLGTWEPIQISRVADGADSGYNACRYQPRMVDYGWQVKNYTGYGTARRTKHICINDIKWSWMFKEQLNAIFGHFAQITQMEWETAFRHWYTKFAVDAGHAYVLSRGSAFARTFSYDPFTVDADGDYTITIDSSIPVSTLSWDFLRPYSRRLETQARSGAVGVKNGRPQFPLAMDLEDFEKMIERDPALREDFRYQRPEVLIDQYGSVESYKGYGLTHDPNNVRLKVKSYNNSASTVTLKLVPKLVDSDTNVEGTRWDFNPEWENAEFGIGAIIVKGVYDAQIPAAGPTSPGGQTQFGAVPSLMGEFKWLNIQNEETNPLNEVGYYFARMQMFPHPGEYFDEPIIFLYARSSYANHIDRDIGGDEASASPVSFTAAVADAGVTNGVSLTMASIPNVEAPEVVTVTAGGSDYTCVVAESEASPTLVVAAASAANAASIIAAGTGSVAW